VSLAYDDGTIRLIHGDCVEVMAQMPAGSVDAIVTDPPYGLEFMGREWDRLDAGLPQEQVWKGRRGKGGSNVGDDDTKPSSRHHVNLGGQRSRFARCTLCGKRQFSGSPCECPEPEWTYETPTGPPSGAVRMQRWHEAWASEALRVLKPGGHLLAFGGSRTEHRMICAVEDAGFEIRDKIVYLYGAGFPKSLNVSRAMEARLPAHERCACAPRSTETPGGCEAGCPGCPRCDGGRPHGDGAGAPSPVPSPADAPGRSHGGPPWDDTAAGPASSALGGGTDLHANGGSPHAGPPLGGRSRSDDNTPSDTASSTSPDGLTAPHRTATHTPGTSSSDAGSGPYSWRGHSHIAECTDCGGWQVRDGHGTALKPAYEGVVVARKPLRGRTVAAQVLATGTGGLNIDACRIASCEPIATHHGTKGGVVGFTAGGSGGYQPGDAGGHNTQTAGRWPANVALDEEAARMLDEAVGELTSGSGKPFNRNADKFRTAYGTFTGTPAEDGFYGDTGGPSRFFYTAKATTRERDGSTHPTTKPLDLMRWLVRLVTPPGGVVLEPFAGSGTTLLAAKAEGFRCIGIERDPGYAAMAAERYRRRWVPGEAAWEAAEDDDQLSLLGGAA
jgi:DNA modification methylase